MVDIKENLNDASEKMECSLLFLDEQLARIRAGKANPRILDGIKIEYYGAMTQLSGVASISTPDARTIAIQPWEKGLIREIEKAIMASEVGITPENNGEMIRLSIPPLTEERRKELAKQVKKEAEDAKVAIRNVRRDANDDLKKAEKAGEITEDDLRGYGEDIQKLTDDFIAKVDAVAKDKEQELLEV